MSMASEELADRLRLHLAREPAISETRMFGGVAFMAHGNMLVCPMKDGSLLVRCGKPAYAEAVTRPGATPMAFTGRTMSGFVVVAGDAIEDDDRLAEWIGIAHAFVSTLPPKAAGAGPRPGRKPAPR